MARISRFVEEIFDDNDLRFNAAWAAHEATLEYVYQDAWRKGAHAWYWYTCFRKSIDLLNDNEVTERVHCEAASWKWEWEEDNDVDD